MNIHQYLKEIENCNDPQKLTGYYGIYFDNFPILIISKTPKDTFQKILDDIGNHKHLEDYFVDENEDLIGNKTAFKLDPNKKSHTSYSKYSEGCISPSLIGYILPNFHIIYISCLQHPEHTNVKAKNLLKQ